MAVDRPGARALAFGLDDPRVPELHRAYPNAKVSCIPTTPRSGVSGAARRSRWQTRRGEVLTRVETRGRNKPPKGWCSFPWFDEPAGQQADPGRHRPDVQGDGLQEVRLPGGQGLTAWPPRAAVAKRRSEIDGGLRVSQATRSRGSGIARRRFLAPAARAACGGACSASLLGLARPPGAVAAGSCPAPARAPGRTTISWAPACAAGYASATAHGRHVAPGRAWRRRCGRHALFRRPRGRLRDVRGHPVRRGVPDRRRSTKTLTNIDDACIGLAVLVDQETCLSFNGLRCDVCYRACPLIDKAITIEHRPNPRTGSSTACSFLPTVHSEHCTGCGKCEMTCVLDRSGDQGAAARPRQGCVGRALPVRLGGEREAAAAPWCPVRSIRLLVCRRGGR